MPNSVITPGSIGLEFMPIVKNASMRDLYAATECSCTSTSRIQTSDRIVESPSRILISASIQRLSSQIKALLSMTIWARYSQSSSTSRSQRLCRINKVKLELLAATEAVCKEWKRKFSSIEAYKHHMKKVALLIPMQFWWLNRKHSFFWSA